MRLLSLLVLACLTFTLPLAAWGRKGHRLVAQLALQDLPPGPAAWFHGSEAILLDHSSDPDQWKQDPQEGPRHFLEMDPYGATVPYSMAEAQAQVGPALFRKAGQLPWVIQAQTTELIKAFQRGDRGQIAYVASILSHYVGDLHVPLHTVANYDGQLTDQKGVHSRWETGLVDRMTGEPDSRPASLEPELTKAPWRWLTESNALAASVLADDRASGPGQGAKGETYWLLFAKRQGPVVKDQLARAGQHTAQLILFAWTQAGQPKADR